MRTKTESFTVGLGLSRLRCAVSYVQTFNLSSVYPHTAELSVSNVGDSVTAVRCDEHSIPSLLPAAFELNSTSLCTCTHLLSSTSNLGRDGTPHQGAHSVSQVGASSRRPRQLQYS